MNTTEIEHGCFVGESTVSLEMSDVRNRIAQATRRARKIDLELKREMPTLQRESLQSTRNAELGNANFWRKYL